MSMESEGTDVTGMVWDGQWQVKAIHGWRLLSQEDMSSIPVF